MTNQTLMKKIYVLFAVLIMAACSGEDTPSGNKFVSSVEINEYQFMPVANSATTTIQLGHNSGQCHLRRFFMTDKYSKTLLLAVRYPAAQASIDGQYAFNGNNPNLGANLHTAVRSKRCLPVRLTLRILETANTVFFLTT